MRGLIPVRPIRWLPLQQSPTPYWVFAIAAGAYPHPLPNLTFRHEDDLDAAYEGNGHHRFKTPAEVLISLLDITPVPTGRSPRRAPLSGSTRAVSFAFRAALR